MVVVMVWMWIGWNLANEDLAEKYWETELPQSVTELELKAVTVNEY